MNVYGTAGVQDGKSKYQSRNENTESQRKLWGFGVYYWRPVTFWEILRKTVPWSDLVIKRTAVGIEVRVDFMEASRDVIVIL
jgi:hypothetical protein